jgi:hypothetical protein
MFKLFGGPKSDHPMAELKEARRLLDEVPSGDAFKALDELTHWHESVRTAVDFKPDHRTQLALMIDEAAQPHARKLQRDYLSTTRPSRFQEQRMWTAVHTYFGEAARSLVACIDLNASGAKGAEAIKDKLPLLLVRALRALAAQIRWQYLRYGPFEDALWAEVARIYAWAEGRKLTQAPVTAYPGVAGETLAEQEFLRAVMLAASSPDSLLPAEIEIAEKVIAHVSSFFRITPDQQPDIAHWIDLASGHPPLRLARPPRHAPTLRFFAAGQAVQELEQLTKAIEATGGVPGALNLGGSAEPAAVLEVLRHLALYWSPKPPERRHPRHRVKSRLNVSAGLSGVLTALNPASSLDFDQVQIENWIVEDVSAGGFGASIPQLKGEWLKLGALVALQPEGGDNWVIGVIRRISRDTPQQGSVGIQSLARTASVLSLQVGGGGDERSVTAVLLNPAPDALEVQVLLPAGVHLPGQTYEFEGNGNAVMLMHPTLVEQGEDYELIKARQMIRDTSGD